MAYEYLMRRKNAILASRAPQLHRNLTALKGGRLYIDLRLWRAPNESDLSWYGKGRGMVGRRDRACCINDAGRIASKIAQYIFSKPIKRAGVDEAWAKAVTKESQSIDEFWADVCDAYTAGQWCWLQADRLAPMRDAEGRPVQGTMLDKAARGDVVRWRLWDALSVPDWSFDEAGNLLWVLTSEKAIDNTDPTKEPVKVHTRTLWQRAAGGATFTRYQQRSDGGAEQVVTGTISSPEVPFVPLGKPSPDPWWFDDVELIQAQLLNLDSLHVENLVKTVYPQLIIPDDSLQGLEARIIERSGQENGERVMEIVREIVRGLDTPLVESVETKGITRFIQPSIADMQGLPTEQMRKRQILFDQAGLALFNKESRQVQTAESKQFDHLDTEATLRARAALMQTAEEKLVEISRQLDSSFAAYKPEWPDSFDVTDLAAETGSLAAIQNFEGLTLTQRKTVLRAVTKLLQQLVKIDERTAAAIETEIDALEEDDFGMGKLGEMMGQLGGENGDDGEGEDEGQPPRRPPASH